MQALLRRKNVATIKYKREVEGHTISVDRHLHHLSLFMGVEKVEPQEQIRGLEKDRATGTLALDAGTQLGEAHKIQIFI